METDQVHEGMADVKVWLTRLQPLIESEATLLLVD